MHDVGERSVNGAAQRCFVDKFSKAFGVIEVVRKKNGTGVWAPPEYWLVIVIPRENAKAIGLKESCCRQIAACSEETVRVC